MVWNLDGLAGDTSEYVVLAVVLCIDDLAPHKRTDLGVIVYDLQLLAISRVVVVQSDYIEGGAALVLLSEVEVITFDIDEVLLIIEMVLYLSESLLFPIKSFLS